MLTFTDRAKEMVRTFLDASDGDFQALRISSEGSASPVAPNYELTLVGPEERNDDDQQLDIDGLTVLVAAESHDGLEGATVDFVERVNESGFEIRPKVTPKGEVEAPTGAIAEKVQKVLQQQVNPAIASHGGAINLVQVKDTELFIEMTGGCQGCAMSRMTLRQGVEKMLKQAVPEITAVHDVTDHQSGDNPYYAQPV